MHFRGPYWFLSNFYPVNVRAGGILWPSVEHAYAAAKLPPELRPTLLGLSAGEAKRAARAYPPRADRLLLMENLVRAKFRRTDLRDRLAAVSEPIIEHNRWHDSFWGTCVCGTCPQGANHLGQILARIRKEIA